MNRSSGFCAYAHFLVGSLYCGILNKEVSNYYLFGYYFFQLNSFELFLMSSYNNNNNNNNNNENGDIIIVIKIIIVIIKIVIFWLYSPLRAKTCQPTTVRRQS